MTICIVHAATSDRNSHKCPDCIIDRLKLQLQAYDKALFEISATSKYSIDKVEYETPEHTAETSAEIAKRALSMKPEEFLKFMANPPL